MKMTTPSNQVQKDSDTMTLADKANWVSPNERTKECFPEAVLMATIGGFDTGYVLYDFTICASPEGYVPIHGVAKMPVVASIEAAKQALTQYWNELPDCSKKAYVPESQSD